MANYIPLQLDKDSGRTVATRKGLAIGNPANGFFRTIGFLHEEPTPALVWNVNHNSGDEHFQVQVFDLTGKLLIPDEVAYVDDDNTTITFNTAQAGKAVFVFLVDNP